MQVHKGIKWRNTVKGATKKIQNNERNRMPYGNKTQDKVLTGQGRLTHWKRESKKCKEVEDKSPEAPGTNKKKKRSPKAGKQS